MKARAFLLEQERMVDHVKYFYRFHVTYAKIRSKGGVFYD